MLCSMALAIRSGVSERNVDLASLIPTGHVFPLDEDGTATSFHRRVRSPSGLVDFAPFQIAAIDFTEFVAPDGSKPAPSCWVRPSLASVSNAAKSRSKSPIWPSRSRQPSGRLHSESANRWTFRSYSFCLSAGLVNRKPASSSISSRQSLGPFQRSGHRSPSRLGCLSARLATPRSLGQVKPTNQTAPSSALLSIPGHPCSCSAASGL